MTQHIEPLLTAYIGNRVIERMAAWTDLGDKNVTFHKVNGKGWKRVTDREDMAIIRGWMKIGEPKRFNKGL